MPWFTVAAGSPGPVTLYQSGIIIPVTVSGPSGSQRATAMWDTGSQISSVDQSLLVALGAPQTGSVPISTVQGVSTVPAYGAALELTQGTYPLSQGTLNVLGDSLPTPPRVLIGRDIQALYRLTVDGPNGTFTIEAQGMEPAPQQANRARLALTLGGLLLIGVGVFAVSEDAA